MPELPAKQDKVSPGVAAMLRLGDDQRRTLAETRRQSVPWWLAAPSVLAKCLDVILAPVRVFNLLVETAVAVAVVAVAALGFMVYTGEIPQDRVVAFLKPLGKKVIDTVQSAAAPANGPVPSDPLPPEGR